MRLYSCALMILITGCLVNRKNNELATVEATPTVAPASAPKAEGFKVFPVDFNGTSFTRVQFSGSAASPAGALFSVFSEPKNKDSIVRRGDAINFDIVTTGTERLSSCSQKLAHSQLQFSCDLVFSTSQNAFVKEAVILDSAKGVLTLTAKKRNSGTETIYWLLKRSEKVVAGLSCVALDTQGRTVQTPDSDSSYRCLWKY